MLLCLFACLGRWSQGNRRLTCITQSGRIICSRVIGYNSHVKKRCDPLSLEVYTGAVGCVFSMQQRFSLGAPEKHQVPPVTGRRPVS